MNFIVNEHKTTPLLIHGNGNGVTGNVYNELKLHQFNKPPQSPISDSSKYTFISWKGGNIEGKKTIFETSGDQYGFRVLNVKWENIAGFWKASQQKVTQTLEAINNGTINTEYVFWCENSDVFFLDNPDVFFERYKEIYGDYDFVWNAERNNYPRPNHKKWGGCNVPQEIENLLVEVIENDNTYNSSFRYLNSGCAFGKTATLKKMLEYASTLIGNSRINDQGLMRMAQYKFRNETVVDRECKLFCCLQDVKDNDVTIKL